MKNSRKNNHKDILTKNYVDKKFNESQEYTNKRFERLFKYLDHRFKPLEQMQKDFNEFKNSMYNRLDWIIKLLEKYDQEYTVMSEKYSRINERFDNHESRITVLEKKAVYKTS